MNLFCRLDGADQTNRKTFLEQFPSVAKAWGAEG
jgi:hypothetical protein